ncbi:ester cyclase [Saccharopolyspora erythraea]|uniref:ester cyclase n=1 Tax=Saccharopolyspora erythraea TaxID=1836 RepID=UPI001BA54654|nr:ester cyclase [Saccharopolyspora erythraea]QUH00774.1 ester cyclase [Saccharopolyspora erythraea]
MEPTAHELYRRWLPGLWNAPPEEMAGIAAGIFTADAVAHWGPGRDFSGPAVIADKVREGVEMFDDVVVELEHGPIVDGDLVAARWTFAGRFRGGVPGFPGKAGAEVRYHGMDLLRVRDGRFAEYWPMGDNLTLMQQLGLV